MDMYAGRVRFLIRRYYAARAQTCFDRATRVNPSLSGSVTIGMTIGPDGAVSAARVARNTTSDDSLGTCLQNEVRQWRLSPPPGGESVMMNLPFSR
jgi:outer membrane biosynthesis protein TonB